MGKYFKNKKDYEKARTKKALDDRRKIVVEIIKNIKRKRPIQNKRLDSFTWWIWVEKIIQDELIKYLEDKTLPRIVRVR